MLLPASRVFPRAPGKAKDSQKVKEGAALQGKTQVKVSIIITASMLDRAACVALSREVVGVMPGMDVRMLTSYMVSFNGP